MSNNISFFVVTTFLNPNINDLTKTMLSIINQDYNNIHYFIFDDGSKKDYYKEIETLIRSDKTHKITFEKAKNNLGVDLAHFSSFKKCDCDYFIWVDVGDYLDQHFFSSVVEYINKKENNDYSWFHFNSRLIYDGGKEITIQSNSYKLKRLKDNDQTVNYILGINCYYSTFLIKYSDYVKMNPNFALIDKDEHGGFWYDAQIIFLFAINHKPMHYFENIFSNIVVDYNSVSRSWKGNTTDPINTQIDLLKLIDCPNKIEEVKELWHIKKFLSKPFFTMINSDYDEVHKYFTLYDKYKKNYCYAFPNKILLFVLKILFKNKNRFSRTKAVYSFLRKIKRNETHK